MTPTGVPWAEVPLGDMLTYLDDRVALNDMTEYVTITVKRRHGGLEARDTLFGHQIGTKKQFRLVPGAFIISRIQCWHQAYSLVPDSVPPNMIASANYDQFAISPEIDRRFFWWLTHSPDFTETVRSSAAGVVIEKMVFNREAWLRKTIALPPIEEQRRIAARIDQVAAKIEEARGLRGRAAQEAIALLASGTDSACFDSGFPLAPFGNVLIEAKNGIYKPPEYWGRGTPCVRMYNIDGPGMNTRQLQLLEVTPDELAAYSCTPGDLVFNRVNSAELVGKTGLITDDYPRCTFESKNMRLRVDREKILPKCAVHVLNSSQTRRYYFEVLKQQCGMATLNQRHVRSIPMPVPPLPEQLRIVAYLDDLHAKVDALKRLQAETAVELDAMLPSILDKAFKGEL